MATFIRVENELVNADQIGNCVLMPDGQLRIWMAGIEEPVIFNSVAARALWDALTDGVPDRLAPYAANQQRTRRA